jgi:streptogramin lyase
MWSRSLRNVAIVSTIAMAGAALAASEGPAILATPAVDIKQPPPMTVDRVPECTNIGSFRGVPDPTCTKANAPSQIGEKGGTNETGPYEVVPDFFKPNFPEGYKWARVGGIFAQDDKIYIYASGLAKNDSTPAWGGLMRYFSMVAGGLMPADIRRDHILTVWDRKTGKHLDTWKQADQYHNKAGSVPHRVRVDPNDPQKHVWIIDEGSGPFDQIIKYTADGKEVMRIQGKASTADIAFKPNGEIWALERTTTDEPIIRYDAKGKEIGRLGPKGSTKDAHCIAFDRGGNFYIGEMLNGRVQKFDPEGKPIEIWPNIRITNYCAMDTEDHLWVFDSDSMKFLKYDTNGKLLTSWGTFGYYPGRFLNVNQFDIDKDGNLLVAEPTNWRPQFFRPKKNANPDDLIKALKK